MIKIYRGSDKIVKLRGRKSNGDPEDFTNLEEVTVTFPGNVTKTLDDGISIIGSQNLGKLAIDLDENDTMAMKIGKNQNIKINYVISGHREIVLMEKAVSVLDA